MVYLCLTLFKLQFILGKTTQRICDLQRKSTQEIVGYFKWLRGWSLTSPKLLDWQRLIASSLGGEREKRFYWLAELFRLQLPETNVFSDSVLWLGGISDEPVKAWWSKIKMSVQTRYLKDLDWIDGEKWNSSGKISQGSLHWEFSTRFNRWWLNQSVNQSNSKEGSSSCQCVTPIGQNEETENMYFECSQSYWACSKTHAEDIGRFWGLDRKKLPGTHVNKPDGEWEKTAEGMILNFAESGRPIFRAASASKRWSEIHSLQR